MFMNFGKFEIEVAEICRVCTLVFPLHGTLRQVSIGPDLMQHMMTL